MLNYPRRDCVSLALEETKRFLESAVPDSMLKKIIFVVFSSNDEFVYKSLLPVYFPPIDLNVNRALPASVTRQGTGASTASNTTGAPRRTLFGSIGEAFRSVRSGKTPETPRSITANEEHALINFESHAKDCETCHDIDRLYIEGRDLCEHGYSAAQVILWHMEMQLDQNVYTKQDARGESMRLEFPTDMFPISTSLLATVERSYRDGGRTRPFVTTNRPYGAIVQDQGLDVVPSHSITGNPESETSFEPEPKKARAHALMRYSPTDEWYAMANDECQIRVYSNRIDVIKYNGVDIDVEAPLMVLKLDRSTVVQRHVTTPEVVLTGASQIRIPQMTGTEILFRCRSDGECNSLLRMIRRAIEGLQGASSTQDQNARSTPPAEPEQGSSSDYIHWNKRLQDVRRELAYSKRASGGLSDLQFKMDRLSEAAFNLQEAQQPSGTSKLFDPSRSPLATRVLVCLTADLKFRPGSYIGMKTDDIVAELRTTPGEALSALTELMAEGEVHHTVDEDTWVVSHPPDDLPVLSQEQVELETRETGTVEEEELYGAQKRMVTNLLEPSSDEGEDSLGSDQFPVLVRHDNEEPPIEATELSSANPRSDETAAEQPEQTYPRKGGSPLDPASEKVYTYLMNYNYALPSDGAHHILDIAAAVYLTREEVGQALSELKNLGLAHVSGKDGWWWASKADKEEKEQSTIPDPTIHDASSLADTPSGADFVTTTDTSDLYVDNLNPTTEKIYTYLLTHPYSPPDGEHHTRDIAAALSLPREEVKQALQELKHLGLAHRNKQKGWWRAIKIKQRDAATSTIRNTPSFKETSPRPTVAIEDMQPTLINAPEVATERRQLETIILDGMFSYIPPTEGEEVTALAPSSTSNIPTPAAGKANNEEAERQENALIAEAETQARWTRIDKRIVDPQVLVAAGEAFDDVDDALVVHRVVRRRAIMRWAEESVEVRERALREGAKGKEKEQEATIRDPSSFADTPPSPTLAPSTPISRLSLDTLNIDEFFSYASPSGTRWTRIDKRLVDPRVLVAEDEDFEDAGDELIVHRVLRRGEIRRWAEESVTIREKNGKESKDVSRDKERYRGERGGKGKEKERDERDEYQEKLDRVIAGDMKEEEMRHFRDEKDDERYI
jgi:hypothetical protein